MIKVIHKAFNIIEILGRVKMLSLRDICQQVEMPKPTVFRILQSLLDIGYVEQDSDTQQYALTQKFLTFAKSSLGSQDVVEIAREYMITLNQKFGETVNLARYMGNEVVYLHIIEAKHQFRFVDNIGDIASFHSTSIAKAIVAFLQDNELDNLFTDYIFTKYTKYTIQCFSQLKIDLEEIRESGVAYDREEGHEGVMCIGVPIFNNKYKPVAALSISIPKIRTKKSLIDQISKELARVGNQISLDMGVSDLRKCYSRQTTSPVHR